MRLTAVWDRPVALAIPRVLRWVALAGCEGGMGAAEAAETFAVSESWIPRVKQRFGDQGEVAPRPLARRGPAPAAKRD